MNNAQRKYDLVIALDGLERVDTTLTRLEWLWPEVRTVLGSGPDAMASPTAQEFVALTTALPSIGDVRVEVPAALQPDVETANAVDTGDGGPAFDLERQLGDVSDCLMDYRRRLGALRLDVLRAYAEALVHQIDDLAFTIDWSAGRWANDTPLDDLRRLVDELESRVRPRVPGRARWENLTRHLRFAESHDLVEVSSLDWPSVRHAVLNHVGEPFPRSSIDNLEQFVSVALRRTATDPIATPD